MLINRCGGWGTWDVLGYRLWGLAQASVALGLVLAGCGDESSAIEEAVALESSPELVPLEAIVKFRKNARNVASGVLARDVAKLETLAQDTSLVHFDVEVSDDKSAQIERTWALIHELRARDDVEYAHPNWIFQLSRVPNDPLYASQWHFLRSGSPRHGA